MLFSTQENNFPLVPGATYGYAAISWILRTSRDPMRTYGSHSPGWQMELYWDQKIFFKLPQLFWKDFSPLDSKILLIWSRQTFLFEIFHRLQHICSKRDILGFYKQATHRRPGDEHFFLLWGPPIMTGNGPKMVHFGPKIANHGRLVNVPKRSKRGQNGQPKCFRSFGSLLDSSGRLWIISDKNEFCAPNG